MSKPTVKYLTDDMTDRIDSLIERGEVPLQLRERLIFKERLLQGLNDSLKVFATMAKPSELEHLVETVTPGAVDFADGDTYKDYSLPETINSSRPDEGLVKVILNGYEYDPNKSISFSSLLSVSSSGFGGLNARVFNYNQQKRTVSAPAEAVLSLQIVNLPVTIEEIGATEVLIDDRFASDVVSRAVSMILSPFGITYTQPQPQVNE